MDIANYSSDSRVVIKSAREVAASFRHPEIDVEHLLIAVVRLEGGEVESILNQIGKSRAFIESITEDYLKEQSRKSTVRENLAISPAVSDVLAQALEERAKLYDPLVEPEHIFIAVFDPKSKLAPYVRDKIGLTKEDIYRAIAEAKSVQEIASTVSTVPGEAVGEGRKEVAGSLRYCVDMTNQAAADEFDPMIGREKELQLVIQILLRRRKNSPVLVGGAGVGKSAIVEGFAQAINAQQVPKALEGVKVLAVDMGSMVAGAKYKGEFEERFKTLVGEVVKSGGKIVLFIDEIHTIAGANTGGGGMDAANLLKPALARGQIRLIGATTEDEYTKYLEKDKALDRRFERVKVEQPTFDEAVSIAKGVLPKYESHHKITYKPEAVIGAVKYAKRYLSERNLPDIALDLIDEAASEFSVKKEFSKVKVPVVEKQIAELETMLSQLAGKDPEANKADFERLQVMYDEFAQNVERLEGFWGHRVEAAAGANA
jgi:ATP-dependent Clp protease ATP-binding subunit ClpB